MTQRPVLLSYAGICIAVRCADSRMARALERYYPNFITSSSLYTTLEVSVNVKGQQRENPAADPRVIYTPPQVIFDSPGFQGTLDFAKGQAELDFSSRNPFMELDLFLRIAGSVWAIQNGGLQLHCAAIASQERAYVFFGHSGSGKTTTAQLSINRTVLSDDLNILLPDNGNWIAYATPFWNPSQTRPNNTQAPLHGLYRLIQAKQHQRREMDSVQALAELISCVPVLKAVPQILPQLTSNLHALLKICPCYWLDFRKDSGFWDSIE